MNKHLLRTIFFLSLLFFSKNVFAEYKFSLGIGYDHSGFGTRIGKVINEKTLLFGSAGLHSVQVNDGKAQYNWSFEAGILSSIFTNHSVGTTIVKLYYEDTITTDFGVVAFYEYSLNSFSEESWNFGISALVVEKFYKTIAFKIGYQF
jgi:hypothetical protein